MKRIIYLSLCIVVLLGFMNITFAEEGVSGLVEKSWQIVDTIAWIGYAVSLGMVIFIGIKYMLGSADAKANMKSAISSYLIGAALVFMASTIALVVTNVATGGTGNSTASGLAETIIGAAFESAGN